MTERSWQPPAVFNVAATLVVFAASVGLAWMAWLYYEYSPWTRDGRVRVYTVPTAPEVSGRVVSLPVKDDQFVHKGDVLFQIDPRTFQNDVTAAKGRLDAAKARAGYLGAVAQRRAVQTNLSASDEDKQNTAGIAGAAEATVVEATGQLDQANLNLERATVRSPVNGWVTNLLLQQGGFAATGQPALTLVDADSFWIDGYFAETQTARIRDGAAVRAVLMGYPSSAIRGHVVGLGRGISVADAAPATQGLPQVAPIFTWVRLAQRIPVRVALDDVPCPIILSAGMTASVRVLEGAEPAGAPPRSSARTGADAARTCEDQAAPPR